MHMVMRPRSQTVPASCFTDALIDAAQDDALEQTRGSDWPDSAHPTSEKEGCDNDNEECHFPIPSLKTHDIFEELDVDAATPLGARTSTHGVQPCAERLPTLLQQRRSPAASAFKAARAQEVAGPWSASIAAEVNVEQSEQSLAAPNAQLSAPCQAEKTSSELGPRFTLSVRNTFLHVEEPEGGEQTPSFHHRASRRSKTGPAGMFVIGDVGEGNDEANDYQASAEESPSSRKTLSQEQPEDATMPGQAAALANSMVALPGMYIPMSLSSVGVSSSPGSAPMVVAGAQASAAQAAQLGAPSAPQADPQVETKQTGTKTSAASGSSAADRTTVLLQNLPLNYRRPMLLRMLDAEGFRNEYDFVYLPMDFRTRAGFGYAFINLVSPSSVSRFWHTFDGYKKWVFPSAKVCRVSWSVPHQGLKAHIKRYRNSPLMHESVPDEYKPVLFSAGSRVPFPSPTRPLAAPTHNATVKAPRGKGRQAVA